jgi:DNA-binding MarR family transcriptional regulator
MLAYTRNIVIHTKCACTRVRRAARALTDAYDHALQPLGLKVTQFSLLRTVARMEEPSLTALAHEMALDRSTLGRNVALLQRQGLLEVSGGSDLRQRTVRLTPHAQRILERAVPLWERAQRRVEQSIGTNGVSTLFDLLGKLEELR